MPGALLTSDKDIEGKTKRQNDKIELDLLRKQTKRKLRGSLCNKFFERNVSLCRKCPILTKYNFKNR